MKAYYNDNDKNVCAWLRDLVKRGLITDGEVDERSITEVEPNDIKGFTRHHFFAGIGGWDYALQLAGWPDDRPVCTASLPCQPFSVAGAGRGKDDERHLLPHFLELVRRIGFRTIFGEQVPGAIKHGWLDDLCTEMGREGYAVRAAVLTAAGAGAPHIRQRLFWVANSASLRREEKQTKLRRGIFEEAIREAERITESTNSCTAPSGVVHTNGAGPQPRRETTEATRYRRAVDTTNWTDCEWIYCRDGKYRPVKPSIKPLVNGLPKGVVRGGDCDADNTQEARVMRLKGYGNSIVPQVAAEFISSWINQK